MPAPPAGGQVASDLRCEDRRRGLLWIIVRIQRVTPDLGLPWPSEERSEVQGINPATGPAG